MHPAAVSHIYAAPIFLSLFDISKLFAPLLSQTHYAFPNKNLPRNDSMKEEQRASHTVTCAPLTPPVSHLPTFPRGLFVPLRRQRAVGTAFVNEKLITASRCFGVISTAWAPPIYWNWHWWSVQFAYASAAYANWTNWNCKHVVMYFLQSFAAIPANVFFWTEQKPTGGQKHLKCRFKSVFFELNRVRLDLLLLAVLSCRLQLNILLTDIRVVSVSQWSIPFMLKGIQQELYYGDIVWSNK